VFGLRYIGREVQRRPRQAILTALGLALGIGLVVTVTAMSTGIHRAQNKVLEQVSGVGTDMTASVPAKQGSGPGPGGAITIGGKDGPQPGESFSKDVFISPANATFDASKVDQARGLTGVSDAAGGLTLIGLHLEGTVPKIQPGSGGAAGGFIGSGGGPTLGQGSVESRPFTVQGVDVAHPDLGPLTRDLVTSGRTFTPADAASNVAILEQGYARARKLKVGSTISFKGQKYRVVGLAKSPLSGQGANVYLPLAKAQALAGMKGKVNQVFARASSQDGVAGVASALAATIKGAKVTTAKDLADRVSGSLVDASSLASRLGTGLAVVSLLGAFAIASLLTLSGVARRVREFGTLKAIGWQRRRVMAQVLGGSLLLAVLGGAIGIGLGIAGAAGVKALFPALQATVAGPASNVPLTPDLAQSASNVLKVAISAPVDVGLMLAAIGLAVVGGLVAGGFGAWRAARLRPAEALRYVE
jgi:ABC-type antimicrobial peptide transport system permease subunit